MTAIEVAGLRVELSPGGQEIVDGISFTVERGEVVGLVGESGSGKTTVALALLGHARRGTRVAAGAVRVAGEEMLGRSEAAVRDARGRLIAYVPQDPAAALNPALMVGTQLGEVIAWHRRGATPRAIEGRVLEALAEAGLPADPALLRRYPHQLSGGQQQRVCIAMAFLLRPGAIVLDEPTTGLDVTTQAHVLATVRDLCREHEVGAVYVSHDLAAVASLAGRVLVMYAGRLVETGPTQTLFVRPGHPYTRRLIAAIPDIAGRRALTAIPGHVPGPGRRPVGCVFAPRCPEVRPACAEAEPAPVELEAGHAVACLRARELERPRLDPPQRGVRREAAAPAAALLAVSRIEAAHGANPVLHGVSFELRQQECLALVGESGSGKTTLARAIVGLHPPRAGEIRLKDELLPARLRDRDTASRRSLQYVFQSPYTALNPRHTVGEILRVPIAHFFGLKGGAAADRVEAGLERVSLPGGVAAAYPDELSGGERQRVAIARALACEPDVLICDEVTSALDVSVQAAIVRLLDSLRERLSILFVTHDLALVRSIADRVIVLERGAVVETGTVERVIGRPQQPYTRALVADTPALAAPAAER